MDLSDLNLNIFKRNIRVYHGHNLFISSQEEFHMRDGQKGMWLHESHMDTNFQSPIMSMINCES